MEVTRSCYGRRQPSGEVLKLGDAVGQPSLNAATMYGLRERETSRCHSGYRCLFKASKHVRNLASP
jgi:hypothetical protein